MGGCDWGRRRVVSAAPMNPKIGHEKAQSLNFPFPEKESMIATAGVFIFLKKTKQNVSTYGSTGEYRLCDPVTHEQESTGGRCWASVPVHRTHACCRDLDTKLPLEHHGLRSPASSRPLALRTRSPPSAAQRSRAPRGDPAEARAALSLGQAIQRGQNNSNVRRKRASARCYGHCRRAGWHGRAGWHSRCRRRRTGRRHCK